MEGGMMRLLLLDDHKLFAQSIQALLASQADVELCHFVTNIPAFFSALAQDSYDIVLIDINLKAEATGFEVIERVRRQSPDQKIVVLSSYDQSHYQKKALQLGASDYLCKSVEVDELMEHLRRMAEEQGSQSMPPPGSGQASADDLTEREVEVLKALISGENKKVIAQRLYISERTLYNHMANIYGKLGVNNLLEAYNKAMELGYIAPVM